MKLKTLFILALFIIKTTYSQTNPVLDTLYQSSYKVYELLRTPTGMYKKQLNLTTTNDNVNASIAATGMGLMSLCIADSMKWIHNADTLVLTTLRSLTGKTPGFVPVQNLSGYYPQLMDPVTGANAEKSVYATLDNAILVSGALFCKKYFKNDSIKKYVNLLWNSINWDKAVSADTTGLYPAIDSAGNGIGTLKKPYSEHILVAWLAKSQECFNDTTGPGRVLWNRSYSNADSIPIKSTYKNYAVLAEEPGKFLPESNHITPYYFCHYYANNLRYKAYMNNSRVADSLWWATTKLTKAFESGTSSGVGYSSPYSLDGINDNKDSIISPQALAGYSPVYAKADNNLINMYKNNKGVYSLPGNPNSKVLWRYSILHPTWKAPVINAVDFGTFLLGLAALPQYCGKKFFVDNNDFFNPDAAFTASSTAFCSGTCIDFTNKTIGKKLSWNWNFAGSADSVSMIKNPVHICYNTAGVYKARLTASNGCGSNSIVTTITVKALPAIPVISQSMNILSSTIASSYQWYYNGDTLHGAMQKDYTALKEGDYVVCITDSNSCAKCSLPFKFIATGINESAMQQVSVYPNPVNDILQVNIPATLSKNVTLVLTDALGRNVRSEAAQAGTGVQLDLNRLAPGIYCLQISADGFSQKNRIIKK